MAGTYPQRGVSVEAMQWLDEDQTPPKKILKWVRDSGVGVAFMCDSLGASYFLVSTQEGNVELRVGSWIVKDPEGEFQVMSDASFRGLHKVGENVKLPVSESGVSEGTHAIGWQQVLDESGKLGEEPWPT